MFNLPEIFTFPLSTLYLILSLSLYIINFLYVLEVYHLNHLLNSLYRFFVRQHIHIFYILRIRFIVPPRWIVEPVDANVERNRHIMLHCQAQGVPTPSIVWKKATGKILK